MNEKLSGKLTKIYKETDKALFGTLLLSDGRTYEEIVVPKSQIRKNGDLTEWILKQKLEEADIKGFDDRFGRYVSTKVARRINWISNELKSLGFIESKKKPNLFFLKLHKNKEVNDVTIFADMRGSEIVPIFEETCPLIWSTFDRNFRLESLSKDKNDAFKLHVEEDYKWSEWNGYGISPQETDEYFCQLIMHILKLRGIPSRMTYDVFSVSSNNWEEYLGTLAEKESRAMREYNDYSKKFMIEVEKYSPKKLWQKCRICGVDGMSKYSSPESVLEWQDSKSKLEMHHVSYIPEIVIPVCKKCHTKIHHSDEYSHLKPEISRKDWIEIRSNTEKKSIIPSSNITEEDSCPQSGYMHSLGHCTCNPNYGREGFCQECYTALMPFKVTNDWDNRKYHKKCWKKLVEGGQYYCQDCGKKCNDFLQKFCECDEE